MPVSYPLCGNEEERATITMCKERGELEKVDRNDLVSNDEIT